MARRFPQFPGPEHMNSGPGNPPGSSTQAGSAKLPPGPSLIEAHQALHNREMRLAAQVMEANASEEAAVAHAAQARVAETAALLASYAANALQDEVDALEEVEFNRECAEATAEQQMHHDEAEAEHQAEAQAAQQTHEEAMEDELEDLDPYYGYDPERDEDCPRRYWSDSS